MSWWERPLALLRGDRTATPPAEASAPATAPAHGEWNDVPRLQRVLAEPLRPVAINDDFRGSLASFADPSFMTPAAHRIDPAVGGLVEGLASPGRPLMSDGPELAVPPNAPRPSTPGHAVQRLISFGSDAPELAVVPLEFRHPAVEPHASPDEQRAPDAVEVVPEEPVTEPQASQQADLPPAAALGDQHAAGTSQDDSRTPPVARTDATRAVQRVLNTGSEPQPLATDPTPGASPPDSLPVQRLGVAEPNTPARSVNRENLPGEFIEIASPVSPAPAADVRTPQPNHEPADLQLPVSAPTLPEPEAAVTMPVQPVAASAPARPEVVAITLQRVVEPASVLTTPTQRPDTSTLRVEPGYTVVPLPPAAPLQRLADDAGPLMTTAAPATSPSAETRGEGAKVPHSVSIPPMQSLPTVPQPQGAQGFSFGPVASRTPVQRAPADEHPLVPRPSGINRATDVPRPTVQSWAAERPPAAVSDVSSPTELRLPTPFPPGPSVVLAAPIVAVQRRVAQSAPAPASPLPVTALPVQAPLTAVPPRPSSRGPAAGEGMSFASMFADFVTDDHEPTLQRDEAEPAPEPTPAIPAEPTPTGSTPGAVSAGAAPAAAPSGNLDELARRLYEPLAARLREELWLDRERAGWLTDIRGGG